MCPQCGVPLSGGAAPQQPQYQDPQQPQYQQPQYQQTVAPVPPAPKKKSSWGVWVVVLIVLGAIGAYANSSSSKSAPSSPSSSPSAAPQITAPKDIFNTVTPEWTQMVADHMLYSVMSEVSPRRDYKGYASWDDEYKLFDYQAFTYSGDVIVEAVELLAAHNSVFDYSMVDSFRQDCLTDYSNMLNAGAFSISSVKTVGDYYVVSWKITNMDKPAVMKAMYDDEWAASDEGVSMFAVHRQMRDDGYICQFENQ